MIGKSPVRTSAARSRVFPDGTIGHGVAVSGLPQPTVEALILGIDAGAPPEPVIHGDGALHVDLAEDDLSTFATMVATAEPSERASAEALAVRSQLWRLPVTPYRLRRPSGCPAVRPWRLSHRPHPRARVVELTTMWAGPLAGHLLASRLGAQVTRVGLVSRPEPGIFSALDAAKERAWLDLRETDALVVLNEMIAGADILLCNFAPRVLRNFGLDPSGLTVRHPRLLIVTMPAFPAASREAEWIAYGAGVHATSGLGAIGGKYWAPAVSYPDPVCGMAAFGAVSRALNERLSGHIEVSIMSAIAGIAGGIG